jgi:hypothetical protein
MAPSGSWLISATAISSSGSAAAADPYTAQKHCFGSFPGTKQCFLLMERFAKRHTFRVYKSPETLYNKKKAATPCRPPLPIHLIPIIASQEIRATFKQHLCDLQFNVVAVAFRKLPC